LEEGRVFSSPAEIRIMDSNGKRGTPRGGKLMIPSGAATAKAGADSDRAGY